MRTARIFNSLKMNAKKLAMIYFSHELKKRLGATSANDISVRLEKIKQDNPQRNLPKMSGKESKVWHKRLKGSPIDGKTIEKLEAYIPNITKSLRHPLWKILSSHDLTEIEVNELVDDLDSNIRKYLFIHNGIKKNFIDIVSYRELHIIARKLNMDALAALLLVIVLKMKGTNFRMLQAVLIVSVDLIFALSVSSVFGSVAPAIYLRCFERFYMKEYKLLYPLQRTAIINSAKPVKRSHYPDQYKPTKYPFADEHSFSSLKSIYVEYGNIAVRLGAIKDCEQERIRVAYYSIASKPASHPKEKIENIMAEMNVDRRGKPGRR